MAGPRAGTCGAFGFGAGRRAVANSRTLDLTRALANDWDSPRRPRCGHWYLNLKFMPEQSHVTSWVNGIGTTEARLGWHHHKYQAGHQYNASIPPKVQSQWPRPHDHTKQSQPIRFTSAFLTIFLFNSLNSGCERWRMQSLSPRSASSSVHLRGLKLR